MLSGELDEVRVSRGAVVAVEGENEADVARAIPKTLPPVYPSTVPKALEVV